ncbi:hypothetical protein LEP1GSC175_0127 [Leptospira santarosai str. HAI821]|nr:hypothetical protein LEP1GSC175_0127 [Leptospira santarosai str. HAI821]
MIFREHLYKIQKQRTLPISARNRRFATDQQRKKPFYRNFLNSFPPTSIRSAKINLIYEF